MKGVAQLGNEAASMCTRAVLATDLQEILCGLVEVHKMGASSLQVPCKVQGLGGELLL